MVDVPDEQRGRAADLVEPGAGIQVVQEGALEQPDQGNQKQRQHQQVQLDLAPDAQTARKERFPVGQVPAFIPFQSDTLPL